MVVSSKLLERSNGKATTGDRGAARGTAYEIEKSLELKRNGEQILGLDVRVKGAHDAREFDVITKNKLIECKNVDWSNSNKSIGDLRSTFSQQNKIAQELKKTFEVHSKNDIPLELKNWFSEDNIKFVIG